MRRMVALLACAGLFACSTFQSKPPPAYVVFFVGQGVTLTDDGKRIVSSAAAAARANGTSMVQVAGPSTKIAPGYNPGLAEPRIALVEHQLLADGVPASKLVRTSLPTDKVLVDASGAQRVEIRVLK